MPDDADDLRRNIVADYSFPNRICIGEILPGKCFIDDRHWRGELIVLLIEKHTAFQRYAHRFEITRLDDVEQRHMHIAASRWFWFTFNPEQKIVFALQRRRTRNKRRSLDSRYRAYSLTDIAQSTAYLRATFVSFRKWKVKSERSHFVRAKTGIDLPQRTE